MITRVIPIEGRLDLWQERWTVHKNFHTQYQVVDRILLVFHKPFGYSKQTDVRFSHVSSVPACTIMAKTSANAIKRDPIWWIDAQESIKDNFPHGWARYRALRNSSVNSPAFLCTFSFHDNIPTKQPDLWPLSLPLAYQFFLGFLCYSYDFVNGTNSLSPSLNPYYFLPSTSKRQIGLWPWILHWIIFFRK